MIFGINLIVEPYALTSQIVKNCAQLLKVRYTAKIMNLIFKQMAGILRAFPLVQMGISLIGKFTIWLCAHSLAIDKR